MIPLGFVANNGSNSVILFDIKNNTVTNSIPVGTGPYICTITPNGKYAYVVNFGSNRVSVINIQQNLVVDTIAVEEHPIGIALKE
ncbi:hypothetical protein BW897_32090 [Bacillus cereus]|uniref:Uncharacterized protein n=1 Tax=Bacillus cereus TaxID=1396 RepID=A0A1S9T2U9_BACCE|nr:hypothetical protein [Bacillus cereus]OOR04326.1 hypothetical protein BW897_32090 [Bacillus cereus]